MEKLGCAVVFMLVAIGVTFTATGLIRSTW